MFGLVMISILVLITVVPPFAVMAVAKAKIPPQVAGSC